MSKTRIRKSLPTPLPIPSVEGPYGKSSVLQQWYGLDFLDDVNNMPTAEDILNRPARYLGMNLEDLSNYFRANRDSYLKEANEFNLSNLEGTTRISPNRVAQYNGFGDLHSNNYEGSRKAPKLIPTWSFNDPLKFSSTTPTTYTMRSKMSLRDMSRRMNFSDFGSGSFLTKLHEPEFISKTFLHSTITTPGGTSVNEKFQLTSAEYPSVVLPSGDLLFYAQGGNNMETGETLQGLCVQDVITGLISKFEVKRSDGSLFQFNQANIGGLKDVSLFVSNGNIFLSFNNVVGSGYYADTMDFPEGSMYSRLFKISLDGVVDESFFPTIFRYERLFNIKNQLVISKNEEISIKNDILITLTSQEEIDALQAEIDILNAELIFLNDEINALSNLMNGGIDGIQKFNALVNVHYIQGSTGASASSGAYYLAFDKLDEYGPFDADVNEYWDPISIGLLKVAEDGSNPEVIFKEDVIFCPRKADDGEGDPYEFNTGNVKKSLLLSSGDFVLYTAEGPLDGLEYGYNPKFIKVSKEGVVDISFTIDGYADSLYENAVNMYPALDYSRLKVSVKKGVVYSPNTVESINYETSVNGMIEMEDGKILIYGSFSSILTDKPVGLLDYDIIHNIYDVGCFALLNSDGSLDTEFNRTGEMSAEFYPIGTNPPAPWDNGLSFRQQKTNIAAVGFQYTDNGAKNNGTLEITFAKVIGDKLYVSFKSQNPVSYNRTHFLDGSRTCRLNLSDLTLDETFDFRYFNTISDIVSTSNGYRVYMSSIANGWSNQSNLVYNHRWILNNKTIMNHNYLNTNINHRAYSMKVDMGLGGLVREETYPDFFDFTNIQWNVIGDAVLSQCIGIFIFEVDEINKSEISFHTKNEKVENLESLVDLVNSLQEYDISSIGNPFTSHKGDERTRDRFLQGLDLSELDLDKIEAYKRDFRRQYTDETLWKDLSSSKIETIDGVRLGYTPFSFGNMDQIGLNPGEYVLSEILPQYFNYLPSVSNMNILKGHTAVTGDVCHVVENNRKMIFINGKWFDIENSQYIDLYYNAKGVIDAKIRAFNDIIQSHKPFTFAAYHIPKANLDGYVQSL